MQRDSIANTVIVALGVCLVCSFFVSLAAVGLKPRQDRNALLDRKRNILAAAGMDVDVAAEIETMYAERVDDRIIDLTTGDDVTDKLMAEKNWSSPIEYDQLEASKDKANRLDPKDDIAGVKGREPYSHVYRIRKSPEDKQASMYVFPIRGYGLWSELKGFVALDADLRTIRGVTYYDHKETPGLGGEVDNPQWKAQWEGKLLFGESNDVQIRLIKNADPANPHAVDALSGATITSRGVENMFRYWMGEDGFGPYLARLREGAAQNQVSRSNSTSPR